MLVDFTDLLNEGIDLGQIIADFRQRPVRSLLRFRPQAASNSTNIEPVPNLVIVAGRVPEIPNFSGFV